MDSGIAGVLIAFFTLLNTALLVYNANRMSSVHKLVDGAKDAAVEAAQQAGIAAGLHARVVGELPTDPPSKGTGQDSTSVPS
jgi:hypothetical protein